MGERHERIGGSIDAQGENSFKLPGGFCSLFVLYVGESAEIQRAAAAFVVSACRLQEFDGLGCVATVERRCSLYLGYEEGLHQGVVGTALGDLGCQVECFLVLSSQGQNLAYLQFL